MKIQSKTQPRLTVRSAAELLDKPAQDMVQMLLDQKYPARGERVFRTPYYQHAIAGMRKYFLSGKPALNDTKAVIQGTDSLPGELITIVFSIHSRAQHWHRGSSYPVQTGATTHA